MVDLRMTRYLIVILLVLGCGPLAATDLAVSAPWSYQYSGDQNSGYALEISVDRISNLWSSGTSGSLRLELWAFGSPYQGGRQDGHKLGFYQLAPLAANYSYNDISSGAVAGIYPPAGIWFIALLLTEYRDGTYFVVDYVLSDDRQIMVCSEGSCTVSTAEEGAASVSIATSRSAYEVDSDDTLALSGTIDAGSDAGVLADIYIAASLDLGDSFYLNSNLEWGSSVVPAAANFALVAVDAPDFYRIPIAGLQEGNYQFSLLLIRAGADPAQQANRIAYSATTAGFLPAFRSSDIELNPGNPPVGEVGQRYIFDFYPFASGGLAPYYFTLETGEGFPPIGIILSPDGKLNGTPSAAGSSDFSVCAVDLGANQSCKAVTVYVQEPPDTTPTGPDDPTDPGSNDDALALTVTSATCSVGERFSFGTIMYDAIDAYGTASGPVGSSLSLGQCSDWSNCERGPNDPASTAWTYTATTYVASPQTFRITLFSNIGSRSESEVMTCPTQ